MKSIPVYPMPRTHLYGGPNSSQLDWNNTPGIGLWLCWVPQFTHPSFLGLTDAFAPIQPPYPYKTWLARNSVTAHKIPRYPRKLNMLYLSPLAIIYLIFGPIQIGLWLCWVSQFSNPYFLNQIFCFHTHTIIQTCPLYNPLTIPNMLGMLRYFKLLNLSALTIIHLNLEPFH